MDQGGCKTRPSDRGWRGKRPVINISWLDAKAFASWLSSKDRAKNIGFPLRPNGNTLRGREPRRRIGGDKTSVRVTRTAKTAIRVNRKKRCRSDRSSPIRSDIYDTSGNVAEWVEDCWHADYKGAPTDGSAWTEPQCQLRVLRGGAYDSEAAYVSSSSRFRYDYECHIAPMDFGWSETSPNSASARRRGTSAMKTIVLRRYSTVLFAGMDLAVVGRQGNPRKQIRLWLRKSSSLAQQAAASPKPFM